MSTLAPSSDDPKSLLPLGSKVGGKYELVRVLGQGAQGIVYEAKTSNGGRVALKVIHRHLLGDQQIFKRFHREAAILGQLAGEHIVKFIDFVEADGLLAIVLEFVDGRSLEALLDEPKGVNLKDAIEIALQICAALGVAHAAGVVHRDLKPANVLIEREPDGSGLRVRVVDFGLAKVVHGEQMSTGLTEQDMIFGTPEYMAPEQARGDDADGRADIYATGVMLYEMTVGKVPFRARTPLATMTAHLTQEPPPPRSSSPGRGISAALEAVIQRALAKLAADRYATPRLFAEALSAAREKDVVITPRKLDDPLGIISTSDTDLHLSTTGLGNAKTMPEMPAFSDSIGPTLRSPATHSAQAAQFAKTIPMQLAPTSAVTPSRAARRDRWVWVVVAIVFAVAGVAIGALVGAR